MKTLQDLFALVAQAVQENNNKYSSDWFIDYSGHVNKLSVRYYFTGWSKDTEPEKIDFYLTEEGIQGAYWFIKTKLKTPLTDEALKWQYFRLTDEA